MILKDCDDARDQEEYWENKKKGNKSLLDKINVAIKEEFGKDPRKWIFLYIIYNSWGKWKSLEKISEKLIQLSRKSILNL